MLLELLFGALSTMATQSSSSTVRSLPELSIEGRVVGEQGEPMPRMQILLSYVGETETVRMLNVNTVGLRSRPPGPFVNASQVRDDLTFQIDGLLGPQMLQVYGAMKPWTVKAIRYRGEDIYGRSVEFRSTTNPNDLIVVLTNQSASVSARLRAAGEESGTGTTVVLIPLDPKTGLPLENAAFRPIDAEGPFGLPLVRPGEYLIAAISNEDAAGDPFSVVRRLVRVAKRITLVPGEQRVIELDLVRPR